MLLLGTRGAQDKVPAGSSWFPVMLGDGAHGAQSTAQEHWAGGRGAEGLPGKQAVQQWHKEMETGPGGVCTQG